MKEAQATLHDFEPKTSNVVRDVLKGLSRGKKALPPKLLYDKRGSEIFEEICDLKEYYPTRAESEILKKYGPEIAALVGERAIIIEPGSGAGKKIRDLLSNFKRLKAYVPIEISKGILLRMAGELNRKYPGIDVVPICADFTQSLRLPSKVAGAVEKKVIFFPGSTIGNFSPDDAVKLLRSFARMAGRRGAFLIGADLKKKKQILERAYDDSKGVTARFNLNLLTRINREAHGSFDLHNFHHEAVYNRKLGRVEMHLVSEVPQVVKVQDSVFLFKEGERIHTESSYKYSPEEFERLAAKAGLQLKKFWTDKAGLFGVYYFERAVRSK